MKGRLFPHASRLGFGCASLGSRINAGKGIAALASAFDAGINWFDLAPAYGDGRAEAIFSEFARALRNRIHICTKYGVAPAKVGRLGHLLRPFAQRAVSAVPALRGTVAQARGAPRPLPLSALEICTGLEGSLKRLATDHVDVFALHDPDPEILAADEVHRALEDVVRSGKARAAGIAGSIGAAAAALRSSLPIHHIQVPDTPFADTPARLAEMIGPWDRYLLATHSIYGRTDPIQALVDKAGSRNRLALLLVSHGYTMPLEQAVRAALIDRALETNPDGVVVLSMFSSMHLHTNLTRLKEGSNRAVALFEVLAAARQGDEVTVQYGASR
jgi:hypothetical protein